MSIVAGHCYKPSPFLNGYMLCVDYRIKLITGTNAELVLMK